MPVLTLIGLALIAAALIDTWTRRLRPHNREAFFAIALAAFVAQNIRDDRAAGAAITTAACCWAIYTWASGRAKFKAGLEDALLAHLASHPDTTGHGLCKALSVSPVSLYPLLDRLETEGRITSHWDDGQSGPRRRLYRTAP